MSDSSPDRDAEVRDRFAFLEAKLQELRRENIDSRTVCGRVDRGWGQWSALRRAQQRQLVRDLWVSGSAEVPRAARARFIAGNDSGEKLLILADPDTGIDPDDFFIVDAFWVETSMAVRGMVPAIDGLSALEASSLIREEACEIAERLAQLAYAERCNLLVLLHTAAFPDAADFLRTRSGAADMDSRYGFPADVDSGTVRALIERYRRGAVPFEELVAQIVARCAARPPKPPGPASWSEVYVDAEMKRDDDDLYWVSTAEDLGILSVAEAETVFAAIDTAAGLSDTSAADYHADSGDGGEWRYFAARHGTLIRVSATAGPPRRAQHYCGADAGWMPSCPGCYDWAESVQDAERFREVDAETARTIRTRLDTRPGGVFRSGAFWFDHANEWTVAMAERRLAHLEAATADIVMYWTWQEYRSDLDELVRLRAFLQAGQLREAAEGGDVEAMRNLAVLLLKTWEPPDVPAARTWLEKAADAGDAESAFHLGNLLLNRLDPPNLAGSRAWFEKAATAGHVQAAHNLGAVLAGRVDPPDLVGARFWYEKAAAAGNADSMFNLGSIATELDPSDLSTERDWFERAAAAGHSGAMTSLAILELDSDTPDHARADALLKQAAAAGNTSAMFMLGLQHMRQTESQDLPAARHWLEQAASAGDPDAMFNLGVLLSERWDPPEVSAARLWYEHAAEAGHVSAMVNLGALLLEQCDPPDPAGARFCFERAAARGNVGAMANLGVLLATRLDPPDVEGAIDWLERAAAAGSTAAMSDLGVLLADRDVPGARAWFERAAAGGNVKAMYYLGRLFATLWQPPDLSAACAWWERAAAEGSEEAAHALDIVYGQAGDPESSNQKGER